MSRFDLPTDDLPAALLASGSEFDVLAGVFGAIAVRAGGVVMDIYDRQAATARFKADASPVCDADEQAEALIHRELDVALPRVPVLAEEAVAQGVVPAVAGRFILVDPVDGTKEFLRRNGEFTVNIAMIEDGVPRAGAVYAPVLRRLWLGGSQAFVGAVEPGGTMQAAAFTTVRCRAAPPDGHVVMASRSHADPETETFLSRLRVAQRRSAGSSLKFCAIAEGEADLYPRFGPTMEWDTAAGDAVLRAAGGCVLDHAGRPLTYGHADRAFRNGSFVAWGDPAEGARVMRTLPAH